jgi:hypothetical protein
MWRSDLKFSEYEISFYIWQKILCFWVAIRSEFSDDDLLWSSFTDLLIDATATAAETKVLLTIS